MAMRMTIAASRLALVLALWTSPVLAQTPAADSGAAPALKLTEAQRQTIYQSVSVTQKNSTAPDGFRVAVGARVPDAIELKPMPQTVATLIPAVKDANVAMIAKQVVVVDPKSKTILEVLTHPD
jgi:hypothetical protein